MLFLWIKSMWMYLVNNDQQNLMCVIQTIVTVMAVIIAVFELYRWKKLHWKERESNHYFNLIKRIEELRFIILEIRAPGFLFPNREDSVVINKIPIVEKIKSLSFSIQKELGILEKINQTTYHFSDLYKDLIADTIIKNLVIESYVFTSSNNRKTVNLPILCPSEEDTCIPGDYAIDYTGVSIIKDDFYRQLEQSFDKVINAITKKIIMN